MRVLRRPSRHAAIPLLSVAATLLVALVSSSSASSGIAVSSAAGSLSSGAVHHDACGVAGSGQARCLAEVVDHVAGQVAGQVSDQAVASPDGHKRPRSTTSTTSSSSLRTTTTVAQTTTTTAKPTTSSSIPTTCTTAHAGYTPCDLRAAYGLPVAGSGQTVAIVDAYDDPSAEADLGVYRAAYGLPPCTTANGCFRKVNQSGVQGSYPAANTGWAQEISLDVDMVSAVCPGCHILLVESTTNSFSDLAAAVDRAAAMGAVAISNSYGGSEFSSETSWESHWNHPGIAITASSGDAGYGVEFPAASQYVTAVGGTTLRRSSTARGWAETAWNGAGSGCSLYEPKPAWQHDAGCSRRTVADVAAVADPNTGVAVYDTYSASGWMVFGGTSVAAPIVASAYALAGNAAGLAYGSFAYSNVTGLNDVTTGSNGTCASTSAYLCTAGAGYDGPTGLGTPKGLTAF